MAPQATIGSLFEDNLPGAVVKTGGVSPSPPAVSGQPPVPVGGDSPGGAEPPSAVFTEIPGDVTGRFDELSSQTGDPFARQIEIRRQDQEIRGNVIRRITGLKNNEFDSFGFLGVTADEGLLRQDMARSTLDSEKRAKFLDHFPEGELRRVSLGPLLPSSGLFPSSDVFIFRRGPNDPFKQVDPPMGDPGEVADVFAALTSPALIGGILGAASKKRFATLLYTALGGTVGLTLEELRGYEHDELSQNLKGIGREAVTFQLMNTGVNGVVKLMQAMKGSEGSFTQRTGQTIAHAVGKPSETAGWMEKRMLERKIPPFAVGDVAENKIITAAYAQAGSTSTIPGRQHAFITAATRRFMEGLIKIKGGLEGLSDANLVRAAEYFYRKLDKVLMNPKIHSRNVQGAVQKGLKDFNTVLGKKIDNGYKALLSSKGMQNLTFDIKSVKKVAADIRQGVWTRKKTGESIQIGLKPSTDGVKLLDDIEAIPEVLTRRVAGPKGGQRKTFTAWKQLDALRTRAADLMHSAKDADQVVGKRIFGQISEILENPKFLEGATKEFAREWKALGLSVRFRTTVNTTGWVKESLHTMKPSKFFNTFLGPGNHTEVLMAKRIMPPEQFAKLKDGLLTRLLNSRQGVPKSLESYRLPEDKAMLRMILGEEDLAILQTYGALEARMNRGWIKKQLGNDKNNAQRAMEILNTSPEQFKLLINMGKNVGSGFESVNKLIESVRAGVYRNILDKATKPHLRMLGSDGRPLLVLDAPTLLAEVRALRKNPNIGSIFPKEEMEGLTLFEMMAETLVKAADDVGGLMQKGSFVAAVKKPHNPRGMIRAGLGIGGNALYARIFSSRSNWSKIDLEAPWAQKTRSLTKLGLFTYNNMLKQGPSVRIDSVSDEGIKTSPGPDKNLDPMDKPIDYGRLAKELGNYLWGAVTTSAKDLWESGKSVFD